MESTAEAEDGHMTRCNQHARRAGIAVRRLLVAYKLQRRPERPGRMRLDATDLLFAGLVCSFAVPLLLVAILL